MFNCLPIMPNMFFSPNFMFGMFQGQQMMWPQFETQNLLSQPLFSQSFLTQPMLPQSLFAQSMYTQPMFAQPTLSQPAQTYYNPYYMRDNFAAHIDQQVDTPKITIEKPQAQKTEVKKPKENKTAPKEQAFTPELEQSIINGTYSGRFVKVNGVTHYRYENCKKSDRVSAGNGQLLHKDAADAFKKMQAAAKKDGISLHVHSGLRTTDVQLQLFRNKMVQKHRSFKENIVWSAPSGFSEHHTGLAMDINCASNSFGSSKEYKWLKAHAKEFGFELSFPENNAQGVGFEPWHWRYIGRNGEYKNIFADARANDSRFS